MSLSKNYRALRTRAVHVSCADNPILKGVDVQLSAGECVGLIGPNGAGKSSLLRIMAGLSMPISGAVELLDAASSPIALHSLSAVQRAQTLAYLPQHETPAWPLAVEHLVGLGRAPWHRPMGGKSSQDQQAIERALRLTDVEVLRQRRVTTLSGGELQRVLLARVFAGEPTIILADEPITALDPYHQLHVMELLADHAQQGGAVFAALHDLSMAARFCSRLILMHHGQVVAEGSPVSVLTQENLAKVYGIDAYVDCREEGVVIIPRQRVTVL